MKLYSVYVDGVYKGLIEGKDRKDAANNACDKYPVKISSKLQLTPVKLGTE